ncbi:MAG: CYTH and CHAD domain-containing protein [Nitrospira sp.]|nr:CYTH and CHAD domain-containing protein [Nitrospira sp.]MDH4244607.1 CYTH and CHAD domain-containing protein [Nitrospira sp.]MDH4358228.1 CYTH and CHAD domain-containing protein [Nitrospira sp.]MDH5318194.1 CYTH and CHAD domain-containing protein [Nitrospira sp.]
MTRPHTVSPQRSSTISAHLERELKLSIGDAFRLPRLPGTLLPRRLLISTYYDTAAYDLAHARITLRHRIERGKKTWQLKIPLGDDRQEVEVPAKQSDPPASLRRLLILHLGHRRLMPVVTLRVWRTGLQMCQGHVPLAEIALDSVSVEKDGTTVQRFRELEIELQQGDDEALHALERQMRDAGASDHDGRPKFFRALSLHPAPPAPQPDRKASVVAHLQWALAQHVGWLLAHDPGTRLGTEIESLHQMRVAVRRVRAVLRTARPVLLPAWVTSLDQELDWLGEVLGPARDLDVQIAYFLEESTELGPRDRTLLEPLISHLRDQRNTAQQVVLNALTSTRYLELIRRLQQAAQDPSVIESSLTVRQLARQAFKKLRKALRRLRPSPSDAALHAIRIKTKRARYAAELAKGSVGKPATRLVKAARAIQDLLGIHQDAIQAEQHIRQFLKYSISTRAGFVAGRMVERQHQRRQAVRKTMPPLFKTLLKRGKKAWG